MTAPTASFDWVLARKLAIVLLVPMALLATCSVKTMAPSPENAAAKQCRELLKQRFGSASRLEFPGRMGTGYYKAPETGNVVYSIQFDMVLPGGAVAEMSARCVFSATGGSSLVVSDPRF